MSNDLEDEKKLIEVPFENVSDDFQMETENYENQDKEKILKNSVMNAFKKYAGKVAIALFILTFLSNVFVILPIFFSASLLVSESLYFFSFMSVVVISAISFIFVFVLQNGFFVLCYNFYNNERGVIGNLFDGFRDLKRSFLASLIYFLIYTLIITFCVFIYTLYLKYFGTIESATQILSEETLPMPDFFVWIVLFFMLVISIFVVFPFSFVWFILYEDKNLKVKDSFKKSKFLLKGQKIAMFKFCCKSAGLPLIVFIISVVIIFISMYLEITSSILQFVSFIYTVSYWFSIIRIMFALSAYYNYLCPKRILLEDGLSN